MGFKARSGRWVHVHGSDLLSPNHISAPWNMARTTKDERGRMFKDEKWQPHRLLDTIPYIVKEILGVSYTDILLVFNFLLPELQDSALNMFGGKSFNPAKDISDLSGKVVLLTGGNTGLGKQTILYLASRSPARIYLAARTASKAEAAISDIKEQVPDAPIEFLPLDLMSFTSIASAADTFKGREKRLDILVNNAGIMATPYSLTTDGYENQFGTNHMGHALLTKLLMPTLLSTSEQPNSDVRIINLSSMAHFLAPSGGIIWDQKALESLTPFQRYGQAKLANILFARELAQRYPQIISVSLHPGIIFTDLYASVNSNWLMSALVGSYKLITPVLPSHFKDATGGALNQTWAATVNKGELKNGEFYRPVGVEGGASKLGRDMGLAKKLWEWTENEIKKHGY